MTVASITGDTGGATWGHIVREGTTRRFTVSGNLSLGAIGTGFTGMEIQHIVWDTDNNIDTSAPITSTFGLDAFETGQVTVSRITP